MPSATPREKLLTAVVDVALAGGITDLSLRAIAEAAGTSHRMLIHHFGSREGLLVEVIRAVEERQRAALRDLGTGAGEASQDMGYRFWRHLRSPELAPQERLFFEVYGQALQGRPWAAPLLDGIVEDWAGPVAAMIEAAGASRPAARTAARLSVAVTRGLLLDVLATGDDHEVDAAMQYFSDMLTAHLAGPGKHADEPATRPPAVPGTVSAAQEVTAAALRRAAALAAGDEAALRQLMHPGLQWTNFRGDVLDYEDYIAGNTRGDLRWRAQRLQDIKVAVTGDTAVLTAAVTDEVSRDGHDQAFHLRLTQVWVRTPEGWRCLAGHASQAA